VYYHSITYYWTGFLILDRSYLGGNLTNSKIAGKADRKSEESMGFWVLGWLAEKRGWGGGGGVIIFMHGG
jgi:hypothetical protein